MSTVNVQPPNVLSVTVEQSSPVVVTVESIPVTPVSVYTSGTFTGPAFFNGISQVVPTAFQTASSTVSGITTIGLATDIVTPNDLQVTGQLTVDGVSTFNDTLYITSPASIDCDIGGDLQGTLPNPTVHRIKNIDIHNNPSNGDIFQYLTSNNKYHWVSLATAGIAAASHTHSGSAITSGTVGIAYLPTGTTSTTVALGDHTHKASDVTTGTFNIARIPTGTTSSTVSLGNHTHVAADITTGVLDIARLPTGTLGTQVAVGNHTHDASVITTGTIAIGNLPTGTSGSTVALGNHTHDASAITTGTFAIGRIPTGTTASTVALGNHTQDGSTITTGTIDGARLGTHTHGIDDLSDFKETKVYIESDCNAIGEFSTITVNLGANTLTTTSLDTHGHFGILNSNTASANNSVAGIGSAQETDMISFGTHKHQSTAIWYIPALSTSTERFTIVHGFSDSRSSAAPTDGAFIQYSDNVNSGKFMGLIYNNTTLTQIDLGVTVAANTWYKTKVVVNADRSVDFYIDGSLAGSAAAGTAPNGNGSSARRCGFGCYIRKSVGTTIRNIYIDYINLQIDTTR